MRTLLLQELQIAFGYGLISSKLAISHSDMNLIALVSVAASQVLAVQVYTHFVEETRGFHIKYVIRLLGRCFLPATFYITSSKMLKFFAIEFVHHLKLFFSRFMYKVHAFG